MNRFIILAFLGLFATHTFSQVEDTVSLPDSIQENLAFELAQIYALDQGMRNQHIIMNYREEWEKVTPAIDSLNFVRFVEIVKQYGYPNRKLLGKYGSKKSVSTAGIVILLHNPKLLVEPEMYQLFRNEVQEGRLSASLFAEALDKYYVFFEGKSLYNSQFTNYPKLRVNGVCITDKELSDSLRLDIGLPPLAEDEFIYE